MNCRRATVCLLAISLLIGGPAVSGGVISLGAADRKGPTIAGSDLKEWLTYIASDELAGRDTFSAGLGLAAGYIEHHLSEWGVMPGGDVGSYLQTVRVLGVKTTSRSSITVRVGSQTRTFKDGDGVTFARNSGGKRTIAIDRVEFAGYGLDAPGAGHSDFAGKDVKDAAVIYLGARGPKTADFQTYRRLLAGRSRHITELQAAASIGPAPAGNRRDNDRARSGRPATAPDFTTVQRLDRAIPPAVTVSDAFFDFVFSKAPARYDELKRRASAQDVLPSFRLNDVALTFTIDADYEVVRTQLTQNVVAIVKGSDPTLRDTYVAFGAHYDHVGYAEGDPASGKGAIPGRVTPSATDDRIWNGADDDGSGTVALMAIAKAFGTATPRPRRSILLVWHAGEEHGLWGSRYFADYPTVPMDQIVAQLNIDMIGRNRDNKSSEDATVYLVGSDRISSELHQINRDANSALEAPLALDYEMNDPGDLEQLYYRSDHYSYAAKGVPIIFFTTGLHPDYHANTDDVGKIEFAKMTRITQLVYETGARLADLDHAPARDNLGPRAGKGAR
jgi:hypothetical protein